MSWSSLLELGTRARDELVKSLHFMLCGLVVVVCLLLLGQASGCFANEGKTPWYLLNYSVILLLLTGCLETKCKDHI